MTGGVKPLEGSVGSEIPNSPLGPSQAIDRLAGVWHRPRYRPGQELTLAYPLVEFFQRVKIAGTMYTYHWRGNTVLDVEPRGTILPLFAEVPRPLPKIRK